MKCVICGKEASHKYSFYLGQGKRESSLSVLTVTKRYMFSNVRQTEGEPVCRKCAFQLKPVLLASIVPIIWIAAIIAGLWRLGNFSAVIAELGTFMFFAMILVNAFCVFFIVICILSCIKDERDEDGGAERLIKLYKKLNRKHIMHGTVFFTPKQWERIRTKSK